MTLRDIALAFAAAALILVILGSLSGCAGPLEIPREVHVPTPVPCIDEKDLPPSPATSGEAELLLLPRYQRTLQLWVDHARLQAYRLQLEAIARRCSQIPPLRP